MSRNLSDRTPARAGLRRPEPRLESGSSETSKRRSGEMKPSAGLADAERSREVIQDGEEPLLRYFTGLEVSHEGHDRHRTSAVRHRTSLKLGRRFYARRIGRRRIRSGAFQETSSPEGASLRASSAPSDGAVLLVGSLGRQAGGTLHRAGKRLGSRKVLAQAVVLMPERQEGFPGRSCSAPPSRLARSNQSLEGASFQDIVGRERDPERFGRLGGRLGSAQDFKHRGGAAPPFDSGIGEGRWLNGLCF